MLFKKEMVGISGNRIFHFISAMQLVNMAFLLFFQIAVNGQSIMSVSDSVPQKFAVKAARLCQEKRFDEAVVAIEQAIQDENESHEMYSWYTRGFIYKEIFKSEKSLDQRNINRELAVESFLKARSFNDQTSNSNNDAALKYLATSYLNDALIVVSDVDSDINDAEKLFVRSMDLMSLIGLKESIEQERLRFLHAKGQRFLQSMKFEPCDSEIALEAEEALLESIRIDSSDCNQRYNLAVVYHRIGFESVSSNCNGWSSQEISKYQSLTLTTLLDAENRCDQNMEIKSALLNVFRFLHDEKNVALYEHKVNALIIQNQKNHK